MITLRHGAHAGRTLDVKTRDEVLRRVHRLWGRKVKLDEEPA
jgi:spore cortex formation protein SpoVR/YcgB (stage V sporulation)